MIYIGWVEAVVVFLKKKLLDIGGMGHMFFGGVKLGEWSVLG